MAASVLFAFGRIALTEYNVALSALLVSGFHCLLRTTEMVSLRWCQIALGDNHCGVVSLPWTKGGQRRGAREMCTLDDPFLGRLLKVVANRQLPQNLICPSGDRHLRLFFQRANAQLGFAASFYKPYSLRRGGATHDYMSNKNLAKTILRGRWSELKTARVYINDGLATLNCLNLSPHQNAVIAHHAAVFEQLLTSL